LDTREGGINGPAGEALSIKWTSLRWASHDGPMIDWRTKRSADRDEALSHLLDAISTSHAGRGVALVDERGRLLAGAGSPHEMWAAARGAWKDDLSTDRGLFHAPVAGAEEPLRLAAFAVDPSSLGLHRAAVGVARILRSP
jgi:hypothetical protein